jgi:hypothetical protein
VLPHLRVLGPVAVSGTPPPLDVLPLLVDDAAVSRRAAQARVRVARAEASVRNGNGRRRVGVVKRAANSDTTHAAADDAGANASAAARGDACGETAGPKRRARSALTADESRSLIAGNDAAVPVALDGAAAAADPTPACAVSAKSLPLVAAVVAGKHAVAHLGCERDSVATAPHIPVSQLKELHIAGPVTGDELAAVASAFPRLRALQCEYGGPCPLDALSPDSSAPLRDVAAAEAAFIAWLEPLVDGASSASATASTAAQAPPESPVPRLRKLRRLRVERPPFDGDRDAATMGTLESLRARSHVLIEFL